VSAVASLGWQVTPSVPEAQAERVSLAELAIPMALATEAELASRVAQTSPGKPVGPAE
jgi:hypothetical protein